MSQHRSFMHSTVLSRHWPGGIILGLLAFAVIVAIGGAIYERISEANDRRLNPVDGRLFDVGGFKMHIECTGQESPAVILESGLGDTYLSWRKCSRRSRNSRACAPTIALASATATPVHERAPAR